MKVKVTMKSAPIVPHPNSKLGARSPRAPRVRENAKHINREDYLEAAVDIFAEWFAMAGGVEVPDVRVSCGFAAGSTKAIGSCWDANHAKDKKANIFISPLIEDSQTVLMVLCHELVHAVCGHDEGHGPAFKRLMTLVGLRGKATATYASDTLIAYIEENIISKEGDYPHAKLSLKDNPAKKQGTRMIKCICKKSGYTVRTTKTWIDKYGAPISPVDQKVMFVEWPAEDTKPDGAASETKEVAA